MSRLSRTETGSMEPATGYGSKVRLHTDGFYALRQVRFAILEMCLRLGVKCVTVFAFSIKNFKRSEGEVDALMELAGSKLLELTRHGEVLDQYGVRLNTLGKIETLPENVQVSVHIVQEMTKKNEKRSIINLCVSHMSRDKVATAVQSAVQEKVVTGPDDRTSCTRITGEGVGKYLVPGVVH